MATLTIDVNELPARYAEAVEHARRGDEVLITAAGQPSARLVPLPAPATRPRVLGMHAGATTLPPDFNEPLPAEFWSGGSQ